LRPNGAAKIKDHNHEQTSERQPDQIALSPQTAVPVKNRSVRNLADRAQIGTGPTTQQIFARHRFLPLTEHL
jgi:hypothetical protein